MHPKLEELAILHDTNSTLMNAWDNWRRFMRARVSLRRHIEHGHSQSQKLLLLRCWFVWHMLYVRSQVNLAKCCTHIHDELSLSFCILVSRVYRAREITP